MKTFEKLNSIDCSEHIQKKGRYSYLSWAWAWATLKKEYPDATFKKHTFSTHNGDSNYESYYIPYMRDVDGWAFVMVTVTVEGIEATEIMPVLDNKNAPIKRPNSFDVNTALQRTLVKAISFFGLGLYIYRGEDVNPNHEPERALESDLQRIRLLINQTNTNESQFCRHLKIANLSELPQGMAPVAIEKLETKFNQRKK